MIVHKLFEIFQAMQASNHLSFFDYCLCKRWVHGLLVKTMIQVSNSNLWSEGWYTLPIHLHPVMAISLDQDSQMNMKPNIWNSLKAPCKKKKVIKIEIKNPSLAAILQRLRHFRLLSCLLFISAVILLLCVISYIYVHQQDPISLCFQDYCKEMREVEPR